MKFAFSTLGCPDWPIEKIADEAARLRYDAVEIRGVRRVFDLSETPEFAPENIAATRKLFADAGLPVVSIDASASFCHPDDDKQQAAFDEALRHVEIAHEMGAPIVRVFGGNIPEGQPRDKWARIVADNLRRLGEAAAPKGVTIALETHDSWCRAADIMPIITTAARDNVKVLWDFMHPFRFGETVAESVHLMGNHVAHCHIKDYTGEKKYEHRLLGQGIIPLREIFTALKRIDYDGCVSLEWEKAWHPEIAEPEVAFPQAISYMRNLDAETD